jgi:hypothetical protein
MVNASRRYRLIACEIMFREFCYCAAQSRNIIDITFMPKGLHDMGEAKMTSLLQAAIEDVDISRYEAILLGYGLCNNGTRGLRAGLPLVVPRAHDCITLLLGSKDKYAVYFQEHPGTYYQSPGWMERGTHANDNPDSVTSQLGMNRTYDEYVAKYGEDNARYLMETLGNWVRNYTRMAYIDTGVGDWTDYKQETAADAARRGWEYEEIQGSTALLMQLLDGPWEEDKFLTIPPGQALGPTYDEGIIGLA